MIFNCNNLTCTNYGNPYRVFQYTNKSPGETCHLWFRASVSKHSIEILRGTACTFSSHSFFLPFNGFWMVLLSLSSLAFSRSSWYLLNALFIGVKIQRWLLLYNDSSLTFLFSFLGESGVDPGFGQGEAPGSEAQRCLCSEVELHEQSKQFWPWKLLKLLGF